MKFMIVLTLAFIFTGCSSVHKSQKSGSIDLGVKSDLRADIDVDMSKKIMGTAQHSRLFGLIYVKSSENFAEGVTYNNEGESFLNFWEGIETNTKRAAAYNAVSTNKADIIVAPQYIIKVKSYLFGAWKEVTAQISGYSGTIKNIKTVPKAQ